MLFHLDRATLVGGSTPAELSAFHNNVIFANTLKRNVASPTLTPVISGSVFMLPSPGLNPEPGPERTLRGTAVEAGGPCLLPVLMVGAARHLFPLHRFTRIPEDGW